ncbi:MAG TPA: hypothetical protein VGF59_35615 [Bryobacteraceae bacterium]|jgi:hypothetical protein
MALVDLTKQIAKEALLSAAREPAPAAAAPATAPADSIGSVIIGQIVAMQRSLKEDEELSVFFESPAGRIRVTEIIVPSPQVAVLTGTDHDRNLTRVVSPFAVLQLTCKTVKVQAGAKASRIAILTPKPKDSSA